jgi:hypothetical protein
MLYPEDKEDMMRWVRYLLRAPIAWIASTLVEIKGGIGNTDKFGVLETERWCYFGSFIKENPLGDSF